MAEIEIIKAAVRNSVIRKSLSFASEDSIPTRTKRKAQIFTKIRGTARITEPRVACVANPQCFPALLRYLETLS